MQPSRPDPLPRVDLGHDVKTDLGNHLLMEGASPVRKQAKRQSLPARLSSRLTTQNDSRPIVGRSSMSSVWARSRLNQPLQSPATTAPVDTDANPEHLGLSSRQSWHYELVVKICRRVLTLPLPIVVASVNGLGDLFNRGDMAPRKTTLIIEGWDDLVARRLRLEELFSAALMERSRRRNEQMEGLLMKAPSTGGRVLAAQDGGKGGERWWTKLRANRHLMDDDNYKEVMDGEPLGSVADGLEWALRRKMRRFETHGPRDRSPRREDVDILAKLARQWAEFLTWRQVLNNTWSYAGIAAKMLKEGTQGVEVVLEMRDERASAGTGDRWSLGEKSTGPVAWRRKLEQHLMREDLAASCSASAGRNHTSDKADANVVDNNEAVLLWSLSARDVHANLAEVFRKEGREEAVRKTVTAIGRRIEVMARGYAILRVALNDLVEGQAPIDMRDDITAVTDACLVWLKDTVALKISADWARDPAAVSQAVACIELSIAFKTKMSDTVAIWLKSHSRRRGRGDVIPATFVTSVAGVTAASEGKENEFAELKRAEARQAEDTDTIAVMVYHALDLMLPCQPIKFHFVFRRFMRFYQEKDLYRYVSRYYMDVARSEGGGSESSAGSSVTISSSCASAVAEKGADSSHRPSPGHDGANSSSRSSKIDELRRRLSRLGERIGHEGKGSSSVSRSLSATPRSVFRQIGGNLVKPRHVNHVEFFPKYINGWTRVGEIGGEGRLEGNARVSVLSPTGAAVANECLVSLLATYGTEVYFATGKQVATALVREGFPNKEEAFSLLRDVDALLGKGVRDRLWREHREAALVRVRAGGSVFARLPPELFRNVLGFLAS